MAAGRYSLLINNVIIVTEPSDCFVTGRLIRVKRLLDFVYRFTKLRDRRMPSDAPMQRTLLHQHQQLGSA